MKRHHFFSHIAPWQRTLYIMFLAQLVSAIGFSNIFPFLPLYVQQLGSSSSLSVEFLAGAVFSAQAITMAIASPIWGTLADRYGRKLMVQRAMFGGAIILLGMAFVQSAEQLVLLRGIQGLITGTVSAANALVASVAPRERSGYAMGMIQVGLWAGVAIGPLVGGFTADAFGYEETFVITAVLLALAGIMVHFGVKEQFIPFQVVPNQKLSLLADWKHVLGSEGVPLTFTLRLLSNLGRTVLVPIAPLFIQTLMIDSSRLNTVTGLVVGVSSATATATAVYLGNLGDKLGHRRILTYSALAAGLLYMPQSFVNAAWQILILQALTGAATGGIIPTLSALLARYTEQGEKGSVYGLDNSIVAAGRAIATLVGSRSLLVGFAQHFCGNQCHFSWHRPTRQMGIAQCTPPDFSGCATSC